MNKIKIFFSWLIGFLISICFLTSIIIWICQKNYLFFLIFLPLDYLARIGLCFYVFNSNKQIYAKTCWLFLLTIFPFIGTILFFVFGVNPLKIEQNDKYLDFNQRFDFAKKYNIVKEEIEKNHIDNSIFINPSNKNLKNIYTNTTIQVIENNTNLFEKTIDLVRQAKIYINIQSYIFDYSGFWTKIFFTELIKKANQGVKIRLIYDWVGVHGRIKNKIFKKLEKYGIEVGCFNPTTNVTMFKGATNYRLHTKILIIDNKIALYGGSNFADEYLSLAKNNCHWIDLNYLIQGNIISIFNILFVYYWLNFVRKPNKFISNKNILNDINLFLIEQEYPKSDTLFQFFSFEPNFNNFNFEKLLLNALYNAKKSVKILTPYFCTPSSIIDAMKYCQKSGINIELIVHNKNQKYVQIINREKYIELLLSGINIYEYEGYLHSKCIIIDDHYVMTGSCNVDYRSIYLDYESEIIIDDSCKALQLVNVFNNIKNSSWKLNKDLILSKMNFKNNFILKLLLIGKCLF